MPLHNLMWWKRENKSERTNCRVVTDNMRHTADTSTQQIALFADNPYCFGIVWHKLPIRAWCVFSPFLTARVIWKVNASVIELNKINKSGYYNAMRFGTRQCSQGFCRTHCPSTFKSKPHCLLFLTWTHCIIPLFTRAAVISMLFCIYSHLEANIGNKTRGAASASNACHCVTPFVFCVSPGTVVNSILKELCLTSWSRVKVPHSPKHSHLRTLQGLSKVLFNC